MALILDDDHRLIRLLPNLLQMRLVATKDASLSYAQSNIRARWSVDGLGYGAQADLAAAVRVHYRIRIVAALAATALTR